MANRSKYPECLFPLLVNSLQTEGFEEYLIELTFDPAIIRKNAKNLKYCFL